MMMSGRNILNYILKFTIIYFLSYNCLITILIV